MDATRRGPHWIDVKSICQELLAKYAAQAGQQRVTIDLSLCSEPAFVIGYERRLRRSFDALMRHGLRAMPDGGRLAVRVERDRYVTVEWNESGSSVPADDLADVSATIVGHGGLLWRSERPDGGTSVTVELRAAGPVRPRAA